MWGEATLLRGIAFCALCAGACAPAEIFVCETDAQCGTGICEAPGFCSFADSTCESGQRYGELSAPEVSGQCTNAAPSSPANPPPTTSAPDPAAVIVEVETGTTEGNASVVNDGGALGEFAVRIDGAAPATAGGETESLVKLTIEVDRDGTYYLWLRSLVLLESLNDMFVSVDGSTPQRVVPTMLGDWQWTGSTDGSRRLEFDLDVGEHLITLAGGPRVGFDRITLDMSPDYVPSPCEGCDRVGVSIEAVTPVNDGEESYSGTVDLNRSELSFSPDTLLALRFPGLAIPADATVIEAQLQLTASASDSDSATIQVLGALPDSSGPLMESRFNILSRSPSNERVTWSPGSWSSGQRDRNTLTPNLSRTLAEILAHPDYQTSQGITLLSQTFTGTRRAHSGDEVGEEPEIFVEWREPR